MANRNKWNWNLIMILNKQLRLKLKVKNRKHKSSKLMISMREVQKVFLLRQLKNWVLKAAQKNLKWNHRKSFSWNLKRIHLGNKHASYHVSFLSQRAINQKKSSYLKVKARAKVQTKRRVQSKRRMDKNSVAEINISSRARKLSLTKKKKKIIKKSGVDLTLKY